MSDIDIAVEMLEKVNYTLVIANDGKVIFSSSEKGIKPLFTSVTEHKNELVGSSVADRVTGKAAAMLCEYAGIKQLKTKLISENAINYLKETNIIYEFDQQTPYIKNRDKSGMCPIETLSLKTDNIEILLEDISRFLHSIKNNNK